MTFKTLVDKVRADLADRCSEAYNPPRSNCWKLSPHEACIRQMPPPFPHPDYVYVERNSYDKIKRGSEPHSLDEPGLVRTVADLIMTYLNAPQGD